MKKFVSIFFVLVMIFGMRLAVGAVYDEESRLTYEILDDGTVMITHGYYSNLSGDLIIPETIDGRAVTAITDSSTKTQGMSLRDIPCPISHQ